MPENKKCQFKTDYLPTYECPELALEDSEKGYCIFHESSKDKDIKKFQEGIREKISREDYDFTGCWFPEHTVTSLFSRYDFKNDASFQEVTFKGEVDFAATTFKGKAFFRGCTFEGDVFFSGATFEKEADFRGRAKFKGKVVDFTEATFKRIAWFTGGIFKATAQFEKTTFEKGADFSQARFKSSPYFEELKIKGIFDFDKTIFEEPTGADVPFRIGKMLWQRQGQYALAGEYYYKERVAKRKQLLWHSPKRWFEYILLDGLCGYGERPLRAIRTGLGVIFGLAFLYRIVGHIYPSPELFNEPHYTLTFLDALYFSVVTFTTLGFGDWRPDPSHWLRYVVASEAFIGAFLMALFIVTFARRMMR